MAEQTAPWHRSDVLKKYRLLLSIVNERVRHIYVQLFCQVDAKPYTNNCVKIPSGPTRGTTGKL